MQIDNTQARNAIMLKTCIKGSIFWIYSAFMLFYGVILVAILASAQTELDNLLLSEAYKFGNETLQLWKQKYILSLISTNQPCPENYEDVISYKWPGTMQGCACPYETEVGTQTFIVKGKCNSDLIGEGCYDLGPTTAEYINVWKGSKHICVQRDPNYSFFNSPDSFCLDENAENYKKCGSGSRAVCRHTTEECPITHISMSTSILTGVSSNVLLNQQYINISDSLYYSYEQETVGFFPLSIFRLDDYQHCAHIDQQNINPDKRGEYSLLLKKRKYCQQRDVRANYIDSIGEEDLFILNPNLYNKLRQLPAYPRPSNDYSWIFSFQGYPQWAFECRANAHYKMSSIEERLSLRDEKFNETHIIVTTIVSTCFVSLILQFIEVKRRLQRNKEIKQFESFTQEEKHLKQIYNVLVPRKKGWVRNTVLLIVLDRAAKLINIPSIFIVYWEAQSGLNWFRNIDSIGCGDSFFNENIANDYIWYLNQHYQYYGAMLGLWWFVFTVDWAYLVFRYFTEIQNAQQEEKMSQNYRMQQMKKLGELEGHGTNIQNENEYLYKKAGGKQKMFAVQIDNEDDDQHQQIEFSKQAKGIDDFELVDQQNLRSQDVKSEKSGQANIINNNNKQKQQQQNIEGEGGGGNGGNQINQRDTSMQGLVPDKNTGSLIP